METEIHSLEQLYNRLRPALSTKREEMKRDGYVYVKEEDIWNYLKEMKWISSKNLSLYQMVCDILETPDDKIDDYLRKKMNLKNRRAYFDEF